MSMSSPFLNDLTVENLTAHVLKTNSYGDDERATYVLSCLVQHLHDFVRETKLTTEEWEMAWQYLTKVNQRHSRSSGQNANSNADKVGKYCTPDRQEMILLSDVLGVSALVDAVNNPISKSATESSVLGPFHNDAHELSNGDSITSSNAVGEPMLISGTVKDVNGMPIRGAAVDLWETNGNGFYDMQDPEKDGPDCRGIFYTDSEGAFYCVGVRSVDYPIPDDGPVGDLLRLLGRSNMRPAHVVGDSWPIGNKLDLGVG